MKEITGRHVLIGFVGAFTIIVGVNLYLAFSAVSTFPGLETPSAYIANQTFDEDKSAQEALGWTVAASVEGEDLVVRITDAAGAAVRTEELGGILGRPTTVRDDQDLDFAWSDGAYRAPIGAVEDGNWDYRMEALALDGTPFKQRVEVAFPE
ncbi:MAG: cbb3-type cytochrome oxidase biogeneisis protein CcoH [Rhodobacteraceae bacterium HLUCCA08]|nr:MAG: cbb3-type cytochrome oxidase biogeneisis protein CcoH [Rhodobacteraceae bacterium HLUCCA08]